MMESFILMILCCHLWVRGEGLEPVPAALGVQQGYVKMQGEHTGTNSHL